MWPADFNNPLSFGSDTLHLYDLQPGTFCAFERDTRGKKKPHFMFRKGQESPHLEEVLGERTSLMLREKPKVHNDLRYLFYCLVRKWAHSLWPRPWSFLHTIPQDHAGITPRQFPHSHSVKSGSHYAGKYEQTYKKKQKKNTLNTDGKTYQEKSGSRQNTPTKYSVCLCCGNLWVFPLFSVILSDDVKQLRLKTCPE